MAGIEQKPAMPEGAASPINYAAGLGFPKLEWLPQEQWNRPSAEPGIRPLSSTAPLAGLFSGFWPGACLLPDAPGSLSTEHMPAPEAAEGAMQSPGLAGLEELLNSPLLPGLATPSDESAQDRVLTEPQAALEQPAHRNSSRAAPRDAPLPASGQKRSRVEGVRSVSQPAEKRKRDDDGYNGSYGPKKQRRAQASMDRPEDRSLSREGRPASRPDKDYNSQEESKSREPSAAKRSTKSKHSARSRSHSAGRKHEEWPFTKGRIISCSTSTSAEMLRKLKFGSDSIADLEGLSPSTAVFLWDYEKQRMHGIFAGTSRPVEDTSKHADYLFEVRVKNYADYRSLPKDVAMRLVPRKGKTTKGQTLLKSRLDNFHVQRLCSAFAAQLSPSR